MNDEKRNEALDTKFLEIEAAFLGRSLEVSKNHSFLTLVPGIDGETDLAEVAEVTDLAGASPTAVDAPPVQVESLVPQDKPARAAGPGFWGSVTAVGWAGTALGAPVAYTGVDALQYQHPALIVGVAAAAVLPAALILFASSAAREARRARTETVRLTKAATDAFLPTAEMEGRARALGKTVRDEIGALQSVVNSAIGRFAELEAVAQRNTLVFDQVVTSARDSASMLSVALQSERSAFMELNAEIRTNSDALNDNVSRQIRLMREASRMVRQEYVAADETFQAHLSSFAASAAAMAERTEQLDQSATNTQMATQQLDASIVSALESLTHATTLTDTARQSAENATQAAAATANAVRETTQRAVADARRVAHMIRSETQAMEDSANATMAKLKDAAEEARRASEEAQAAADRHAAAIQRRLSAMAGAAQTAQRTTVEAAAADQLDVPEKVYATAGGRPVRAASVRPETVDTGAGWSLPHAANDHLDVGAPVRSLASKALETLLHAGVNPAEVFSSTDLDFIAARARQGAPARRHAVNAAAPQAVQRLANLFQNSPQAHAEAMAFRAKPDLGAQPRGKHVLVAYLLMDAALG